jgi:hypothetical protein
VFFGFEEKPSEEDIDYLYKAQLELADYPKAREWLHYVTTVFEMIQNTLRFHEYLKNDTDYSHMELLEIISWAFRNYFSRDEEIVYETAEGGEFYISSIGRLFVHPAMTKILTLPGKYTTGQFHFCVRPTDEDIQNLKTHLDIRSVLNYKEFGPSVYPICYDGSEKISVEFFHDGEKLGDFKYPIRQRYNPLMNKVAKKDWGYAEKELRRCIDNYDPSEGMPPAPYFTTSLKNIPLNIYKSETTTVVPDGDNRERILKTELEHSAELEGLKSPDDTFKQVALKDAVTKIKESSCRDQMDIKIIDMLIDGTGSFENDKINFSAIAQQLGTNDNEIRRRWDKICSKVKKTAHFL